MKIKITPEMRIHLAYAESIEVELPDGWKLVPVEATEHMLNAGKQAADSYYVNPAKIESRECKVYRHMLAAAPEVPK